MAVMAKVKVEITGMKRARLLVLELTEVERDLARDGQREYAARINHALRRFTSGPGGDPEPNPPRD